MPGVSTAGEAIPDRIDSNSSVSKSKSEFYSKCRKILEKRVTFMSNIAVKNAQKRRQTAACDRLHQSAQERRIGHVFASGFGYDPTDCCRQLFRDLE